MRITKLILGFSILLGGCIEPLAEPSGHIVVVGNGADASMLVVDMRRDENIESFSADKDLELKPIMAKIGESEMPSQLDWLTVDEATKDTVIQVKPSDSTTSSIYVQDSEKPEIERKEELEILSMSSDVPPQFLSNGAILFLTQDRSLRYSPDQKTSFNLSDRVVSTFVDKNSQLFVQSRFAKDLPAAWKVFSLTDVSKKKEDFSKVELAEIETIPADILYQAQSGRIFYFNFSKPGRIFEVLENREQKELKWAQPAVDIVEINASSAIVVGERLILPVRSKDHSKNSWDLASIDETGIRLIDDVVIQNSDFSLLEGQKVFAFRKSLDSRDVLICNPEGKDFACSNLVLPEGFQQVALGTEDKLIVTYLDKIASIETDLNSKEFGKIILEKSLELQVERLRFFPLLELVPEAEVPGN